MLEVSGHMDGHRSWLLYRGLDRVRVFLCLLVSAGLSHCSESHSER